jgi:hypothetical protein
MPKILMRTSAIAALILAASGIAGSAAAQGEREGPEEVIRALVMAIYGNDVASYNRLTIPHPMRSRLTSGGRVNQERLDALKQDPGGLQIIPKRPPMLRGEKVEADAKGDYPVGTTALFVVAHGRGPMVVTLARRADGWKVDLRWWIAMTELASGREPAQDSPEFAIRSLLEAMLRLDRAAAARFAAPGADMELLFDGAPRQREPSGVLDAAVFEMPLVEIEPGEFARTPTDKVVEGTQAADRKVLVGQFGPVEIPFVVRRVGTAWRVEAEPYFVLMNR